MKRFKDFSIRMKFVVMFMLAGILLGTLAFIASYSSLILGLDKIESFYLETAFQSVQTAIDTRLDTLLSIVKDYAYWDDMYNYIDTRDENWSKVNITEWIPKNFKIDLILIFDAAGGLIYQYGDFEEFKTGKDLSNHPLKKITENSKELKGFYSTSKGTMLVASSQIMHTDESGPKKGVYLYGKLINNGLLEELKRVTGVNLSLISEGGLLNTTINDIVDRKVKFEDIYNKLAADKSRKFSIYKTDYRYAFVYTILTDIEHENIGMLEIMRPRKSIVLVKGFFTQVSVWILILSFLAGIIVILVVTGIILKPLKILKKTIEEIQKTKDMLKRVKIESEDEFGVLAVNFNSMMDVLTNTQNELAEAQKNIIESARMATAAELAMGTVHQINNPLSIAMGRVQMLRRILSYKADIPESDLEKDLKIIEEQTRRAVDITNSLLRYALPITFRFERCDINELLQDIIGLNEESLRAQNISIIANLKTDLPFVQYCDPQQIKDVFMNIIKNAEQAMSGGGRLEVSTDCDEKKETVSIKFTDNGCGIPPENRKKLFSPFFSTKADKCGLGLPVSYNIIKGHRGALEVESEVGKGSTFTIKLPVGK